MIEDDNNGQRKMVPVHVPKKISCLYIFFFDLVFGFSLINYKGRNTRCDKSLRHIAATSLLVCTAAATSRCDKTLVRCTQSILKKENCKLVQI